jgi:hypothetical protein
MPDAGIGPPHDEAEQTQQEQGLGGPTCPEAATRGGHDSLNARPRVGALLDLRQPTTRQLSERPASRSR